MAEENQQTDNNPSAEVDIEKLQIDLDNAMNGWKRAQADFENYKKRKEGENKELVDFAREVTVAKLLPALDSLEQALKHMPEASDQWTVDSGQEFIKKYQNWQEGINAIIIQLDKTLGELGVKKIEVIPDKTKFDPNFHEAVRHMPQKKELEGIIEQEIQTGYQLNGKIIRPSMVSIYSESIVDPMAKQVN